MPKTVLLPNAQVMSFPEDATTEEMNLSIGAYFPELFSPQQTPEQLPDSETLDEIGAGDPRQPSLGNVFGRSWDQMEQLLGYATQATGEALNSDTLKNYGRKVIKANQKELDQWDIEMPPLLKFSEIEGVGLTGSNERGAWDYFQQGIANVLPYIIAGAPVAAAGAVVGPSIVPTIGSVGAKGIAGILGRMTASRLGKKAVGAATFRFLPSSIFGTGEAQQEIKELDPNVEDPYTALKYGMAIGALDAVSLAPLMIGGFSRYGVKPVYKALTKGAGEKVAKGATATALNAINKAAASRLGKGSLLGLTQATSEGFTERMQEILAMEAGFDATGKRISVAERAERLLEATAQGAFVGGGIGVTTGTLTGGTRKPLIGTEGTARRRADKIIEGYDLEEKGIGAEEIVAGQAETFSEKIDDQLNDPKGFQLVRERILSMFGPRTFRKEKITEAQVAEVFNRSPAEAKIIIKAMQDKGILNEQLGVGPAVIDQVRNATSQGTAAKQLFGEDIKPTKKKKSKPIKKKKWSPSIPNRKGLNNYRGFQIVKNEEGPTVWQFGPDTIDPDGNQVPQFNDAANSLKEAKAQIDQYYDTGAIFNEEVGVLFPEQDAERISQLQEQRKDTPQPTAKPKAYTKTQIDKVDETLEDISTESVTISRGKYKGKTFEIKETKLEGVEVKEGMKPFVLDVTIDGVLQPELRSDPYSDNEYVQVLRNILPNIMSAIDGVKPVEKDVKAVEEDDEVIDTVSERVKILTGKPITLEKVKTQEEIKKVSQAEAIRESFFTGSIKSKDNQAKLLEAFGGDQNMLDQFNNEINQLQDMIRTFAVLNTDGSLNKSQAQRMAADVANFDMETVQGMRGNMIRLNAYEYVMSSMNGIARKYPAFAKMFNLLMKYNTYQRTILSEFNDYYRPLGELNKEDNVQTKRFITVANILGSLEGSNFNVAEDGNSATVMFPEDYKIRVGYETKTGQDAVDYSLGYLNKEGNPNRIIIGQPVTLDNAQQVEAFMALKRGLQASFFTRMESLVKYMDEDGSLTEIVDKWSADRKDVLPTDLPILGERIAQYASKVQDEIQKKFYTDLAIYVTDLQSRSLENYFPNVRQGDGVFRIVEKGKGKDSKTVWRTDLVMPFYVRNKENYTIEWAKNNLPEELLEQFPPSTDINKGYQWEYKTNEELDNESDSFMSSDVMSSMILAADKHHRDAKGKTSVADREKFKEDLKSAMNQIQINRQRKGLQSHYSERQGVPGYMTPRNFENYHDNAYSIYQSKVARYVARINTEKEINEEMELLKKVGQPQDQKINNRLGPLSGNIYKVAEKARNFTFAPQSSMNMLKSVAFYGFLGGNISSILVNMMQSAVSAVALTSAYGLAGSAAMLKAFPQGSIIAWNVGIRKRGLFIPSLDSPEEFNKNKAEELYQTLKRRRLVRDRGEYEMLAKLTQRGIIGKVNTEALSQNSDLTAQYFVDKFGLNRKNTITNTALRGALGFGRALATLYAYGEVTNRIATALATYRLAKSKGVDAINKLNSAEVARSNLTDTEEGYIDAAEAMTTMTQFSLDAYNRPLLARQMGGVPIQFLPFVQMMIELYSNAIMGRFGGTPQIGTEVWTDAEIIDLIEEGKDPLAMGITAGAAKEQGRTSVAGGTIDSILGVPIPSITNRQAASMLIGLVTMQMTLAGAYGMPYADDLNEVIKLLAKATGLPAYDVKQEIKIAMMENGVDEKIANTFNDGILSSATGISLNHRFSLNMIANYIRNLDNPALLVGGPAASFLGGYTDRIGKYLGQAADGNPNGIWKTGIALVPSGLTTNILKSLDVYNEGETTKSGNILTKSNDIRSSLLRSIGFTTTEVAKARRDMAAKMYVSNKRKALNKKFTTDVATLYYKLRVAEIEGRPNEAQELFEKIQEIRRTVLENDSKSRQGEIWSVENMIDPNGTLFNNAYNRAKQFLKVYQGQSPVIYTNPTVRERLRVNQMTGQPNPYLDLFPSQK